MQSIAHKKPGWFPTPPGTCFTKPDLPYPDGHYAVGNNNHPFIIVSETDDSVEVVMAQTLACSAENKNHADRIFQKGFFELKNPCPPMDERSYRTQYTDASKVMVLPKTVLYEATDIRILNNKGDRLSEAQTQRLQYAVRRESLEDYADYTDPYDYENNDYDMSKWLPKKRPLPHMPNNSTPSDLEDQP